MCLKVSQLHTSILHGLIFCCDRERIVLKNEDWVLNGSECSLFALDNNTSSSSVAANHVANVHMQSLSAAEGIKCLSAFMLSRRLQAQTPSCIQKLKAPFAIRDRTRSEGQLPDFQAIVISLKDYFFSKADALVGVTKAPGSGCSATFTLDLTQYAESEE